jgi:transcriptional antiterminator NusG
MGDKVRVGDGPFEGQEGLIGSVDEERGRVQVDVSIFGRSTPVELEYWQVEKL